MTFPKVKNNHLKSSALIAVIVLSDERFEIIKDYKNDISASDELKIIDILYNKESQLPPDIDYWLNNQNVSIIILTIKLIVRFREHIQNYQLELLLNNENKLVRRETLLAIKDLILLDADQLLINHYPKETNKTNKKQLLQTLTAIGNEKCVIHFDAKVNPEDDLDVKFEIVKMINTIDGTHFGKTENCLVVNYILKHINNPYLA